METKEKHVSSEPKRIERTVGAVSAELLQKTPDTLSPIENMQEQLTDWDKNIFECLDNARKQYPGDFFIMVITKKEPLLKNVLRNYFIARQTCPTPGYDQAVYKYDHENQAVNFLWVVPSKDTVATLFFNKDRVVPEEWGLLQHVLNFMDGTLDKRCMKLNGEFDVEPSRAPSRE